MTSTRLLKAAVLGSLLLLVVLSTGCTQEPELQRQYGPPTVQEGGWSTTSCVLSKCDCLCYPRGSEPPETPECNHDCATEYGVTGCRLVGGECMITR